MNKQDLLQSVVIGIVVIVILAISLPISCNRYIKQPKRQSEALERIADSLESIDQKLAP